MTRKKLAHLAGLLYLLIIITGFLIIITGFFAEVFVRQALNVPGDVLATAQHIQSSEMLYRLGFVADLCNFVLGLPCVLIIYILFKPVHRYLMLLALFFVLMQTAIIAGNLTNQLSPLLFLEHKPYLNAFSFSQLATLSKQALALQAQGYAIGLVFFGCYCLIIGYLIFKSGFMPRLLGVLYALAGLCYLINSFTMFLSPGFANPLFPYILVPSFVGELSFTLWLLIKGVKENASLHEGATLLTY